MVINRRTVGTLTALFWVAWAWVAEKQSDFQFTEKIFQKALSVGAEPKKFLEERQKQFLRRMSRHWLNASQANEDDVEDGDDEDRLVGLVGHKLRRGAHSFVHTVVVQGGYGDMSRRERI